MHTWLIDLSNIHILDWLIYPNIAHLNWLIDPSITFSIDWLIDWLIDPILQTDEVTEQNYNKKTHRAHFLINNNNPPRVLEKKLFRFSIFFLLVRRMFVKILHWLVAQAKNAFFRKAFWKVSGRRITFLLEDKVVCDFQDVEGVRKRSLDAAGRTRGP